MKLDDLIADGNTALVALARTARKHWPAMSDDATIVLVGPGSKIAVRVGCCQRDIIDMKRVVDDTGKTLGFVGYSHKANKLAVRLHETPDQTPNSP